MPPAKPQGKQLFDLIEGLRHFGAGCKVTRSIYKVPNTYWLITRVKKHPFQAHGTVYGQLVWNGRARKAEEEVRCPLKKQWLMVAFPDYKAFTGDRASLDKLLPLNQGEGVGEEVQQTAAQAQ